MATVSRESNRNGYRLQFRNAEGRRKSVWLGDITADLAGQIKRHVTHIVDCDKHGEPYSTATTRWVKSLPPVIRGKLAKAGLVEADVVTAGKPLTVDQLCETYISGRSDWKPRTIANYKNCRRWLAEFFGVSKSIESVTPADMARWLRWMQEKGQSEATAMKEARRAKEIFAFAVASKLAAENPVAMKIRIRTAKDRQQYVPRETIDKCIEASPDPQWKLIFALTRFQGFRCPSEVLKLEWADIDFAASTIRIESSKTEKHESGIRTMPIFPATLPHLLAVKKGKGRAKHVITRYRDLGSNISTTAKRYVRKAGFEPWPKLFTNLRSSARTDAEDVWPNHVCNAWFGHCAAVAREHYLQVKPEHIELASKAAPFASDAAESKDGSCPACGSREVLGMVASFWADLDEGLTDLAGQWTDYESSTELTDRRMCRECGVEFTF